MTVQSTGIITLTTATQVDYNAGRAWTNAGNALTVNSVYATASAANSSNIPDSADCDWLVVYGTTGLTTLINNPGIIIKGVEIVTTSSIASSGGASVSASAVSLVKNGAIVGTAKTINSGAYTNTTLGSSTDLWGTTITRSDLATLGASLRVSLSSVPYPSSVTVSTDAIRINIYYDVGTSMLLAF